MKRLFTTLMAVAATVVAMAQTLSVKEGSVTWLYDANTLTAPMVFADGTVLVGEHSYVLADTELAVDATASPTTIEGNVVKVEYVGGTSACVVAPGTLAHLLTIKVDGANVDITADASIADEITYRLRGTGASFVLHGEYKSTVVLDGVSLTATGTIPALWVDNGKRIEFQATDGTENTFTDSPANVKKGAFFVKGHAEWKGAGNVSISGLASHAYNSKEYTYFKSSFTGQFRVLAAKSDGLHIEQYLQVNNGTITVAGNEGDGIDVGYVYEDDETTIAVEENNGQFIMNGGTITVAATTPTTKGVKCDDKMTITAGRINATASGDGSRGISAGTDLYLGQEGGTSTTDAYLYLVANGSEYTDPATGETDKCRGLKVKRNFYHYPSTVERDAASSVTKKKIVDVDGTYFALGGKLVNITVE